MRIISNQNLHPPEHNTQQAQETPQSRGSGQLGGPAELASGTTPGGERVSWVQASAETSNMLAQGAAPGSRTSSAAIMPLGIGAAHSTPQASAAAAKLQLQEALRSMADGANQLSLLSFSASQSSHGFRAVCDQLDIDPRELDQAARARIDRLVEHRLERSDSQNPGQPLATATLKEWVKEATRSVAQNA